MLRDLWFSLTQRRRGTRPSALHVWLAPQPTRVCVACGAPFSPQGDALQCPACEDEWLADRLDRRELSYPGVWL